MSLTERFDAVQTSEKKTIQEDQLHQMSLPQLAEMTISFGQTKLGQKYGEVINTDPRYCRWFLGKYGDSQKMEHRTFVRFLRLWIERKELEQKQQNSPSAKTMPNSRPLPDHGKRSQPSPSVGSIDLDEEPWDEIQLPATENLAEEMNAHRLDQVEGVLKHVLTQLQLLTNHSNEA